MIAWRAGAVACLIILGIAALGIAGLSLALAATTHDLGEAADAERDGLQFGTMGLVLVALAAAVRLM